MARIKVRKRGEIKTIDDSQLGLYIMHDWAVVRDDPDIVTRGGIQYRKPPKKKREPKPKKKPAPKKKKAKPKCTVVHVKGYTRKCPTKRKK